MVVLNRIYTRSGDGGDTALGTGERVAKYALRVEAYGTVDEVNSVLGLARLHAGGPDGTKIDGAKIDGAEIDGALGTIQNDLFDLGADLCRPDLSADATADYPPLRMTAGQTARLEREIDAMTARLEPLRSFILPAGTALSAHLHHARTVSRRAERLAVALAAEEEVNAAALTYLNRLSDWLFCAARIANDAGRADVLWVPGASR